MPICFRLLVHWMRRAASRAAWTAGSKQGDQHGDDGDHHQQFDQCKGSTMMHFGWTPRRRNLGAQRDVKPTARRSRMLRGAAISRNGRCLTPRTRNERADGDRAVSIAMAWNQARMRRSGGRSRREARRAGRRQRVENGSRMPTVSSRRCPNIASDALLPTGPSEGALGSPESPQGAEFIWHGLAPARSGSGVGSGAGGRVCGS